MNIDNMRLFGAICGDIVGSPYEFNNIKTKTFPILCNQSKYTDDTILTLAVAEGIVNGYKNKDKTYNEIKKSIKEYVKTYPNATYGYNFLKWVNNDDSEPYNSFGNGSAMRVSSVAWVYNSLKEIQEFAEITAKITHNHPEGIKGAVATASAIFLARQNESKENIKQYITENFRYELNNTCDKIRPDHTFNTSCQETVPESIIAFLEGNSFEDVLRLAVSLGGDSDTIAAIAGSIAEAYYPIDTDFKTQIFNLLDLDLKKTIIRFNEFIKIKQNPSFYEINRKYTAK